MKVSLKDIKPGDALTASDLNTTIASWNTSSEKINAQNVRDGGLDQRNFGTVVTNSQVNTSTFFKNSLGHTPEKHKNINVNGPYPLPIHNGPNVNIGSFTYKSDGTANRAFVLRLNFEYNAALNKSIVVGRAFMLHYRLGYEINNDGIVLHITDTTRRLHVRGHQLTHYAAKGSTGLSYVFYPEDHYAVIQDGAQITFHLLTCQSSTDSTNPTFVIENGTFSAIGYDR